MVLAAILLAVLAGGLLLGLSRVRLAGLLAGAWAAGLALALILPRAVSLRLLGWDWRAMLIATGLGLAVAGYVHMIRRVRRLSGIDRLRAEAEAARAEGAALQAGLDAARAQARADALRAPPAPAAPPAPGRQAVLVHGPDAVTAPLCLVLAGAGITRITLAGGGGGAVACAVSALHPACRVDAADAPRPEGHALALVVGDAPAPAGLPLVRGWLEGTRAHLAARHAATGPHDGEAPPGHAAILGALMAGEALALLDEPARPGRLAVRDLPEPGGRERKPGAKH